MKKYLLAGGLATILFLSGCVQYEDGEPVGDAESEEVEEQEVSVEEPAEEPEEGVEKEAKEKAEEENTDEKENDITEEEPEESESTEEVVETPLTPVEEIENIITGVVGEDKITELNVEEADGSYEVDLTYAASENFTTNMTASGIKRNMVDITLKLQESEHYVSYLLMAATLPLTDSTGNESDGEVMTVSFYGETIEQLNPDNEVFLYDNLESAADGYSAHPQFR